jgi:adenosylhomocysteine nucleosidase
LLIVTPQQVEVDALRAVFHQLGHQCNPIKVGRLRAWRIPEIGLALAVGGHGKAQFALQAQHLLDRLANTEALICVGGAGGIDSRLRVGDIVVGTATVEHDYRIRFIESSLPVHSADANLVARLKLAAESAGMANSVWFDRIASGDEDIVDVNRAAELREATGAVCVAWEGSGGARAAAFNGVPFVGIRGITDAANETAHGDYHQNLQLVMPRIVKLLL